jgi:hypothetical protein
LQLEGCQATVDRFRILYNRSFKLIAFKHRAVCWKSSRAAVGWWDTRCHPSSGEHLPLQTDLVQLLHCKYRLNCCAMPHSSPNPHCSEIPAVN